MGSVQVNLGKKSVKMFLSQSSRDQKQKSSCWSGDTWDKIRDKSKRIKRNKDIVIIIDLETCMRIGNRLNKE